MDNQYQSALSYTLIVSFILHAIFFINIPHLNFRLPTKNLENFEVNFYKIKEDISILKNNIDTLKSSLKIEEAILPPKEEAKVKDTLREKFKDIKILDKFKDKTKEVQPQKTSQLLSKKIEIPPLEEQKMDIPEYKNYYARIRNRIKNAAYLNYTVPKEGEVFLNFILTRDGKIKNIVISQEHSVPHKNLKRIALNSLKQASPYPKFPKEIDLGELSFNLVISFQSK